MLAVYTNVARGHRCRLLLLLAVVRAVGPAAEHSAEEMLAAIDAASGASGEHCDMEQ